MYAAVQRVVVAQAMFQSLMSFLLPARRNVVASQGNNARTIGFSATLTANTASQCYSRFRANPAFCQLCGCCGARPADIGLVAWDTYISSRRHGSWISAIMVSNRHFHRAFALHNLDLVSLMSERSVGFALP